MDEHELESEPELARFDMGPESFLDPQNSHFGEAWDEEMTGNFTRRC